METLFETGSLTNENLYRDMSTQLDLPGPKLNVFIEGVERGHRPTADDIPYPVARIPNSAS